MQGLPITSIFAAVFAILLVLLSFNVIRERDNAKALFGDGGQDVLKRAIRAHGNFIEYIPIFLLLSGLNELAGINPNLLYVTGFIMLYGRIAHAYGVLVFEQQQAGSENVVSFRKTGMHATLFAIALHALLLLAVTLGF